MFEGLAITARAVVLVFLVTYGDRLKSGDFVPDYVPILGSPAYVTLLGLNDKVNI